LLLFLVVLVIPTSVIADEHKTLEIGASALDFELQGIDGKTYTLRSFKNAKFLAVVFIGNVETLKKVIFDDPMIGRIYKQ
jgi:hypothetical protein